MALEYQSDFDGYDSDYLTDDEAPAQATFTCTKCSEKYFAGDMFQCCICSLIICDNCLPNNGKWVHNRETCKNCIDNVAKFHTLNFVCSSDCESILFRSYY